MNRALILFAKEPHSKVKSRLQKVLTLEKVVLLYQSFLQDMLILVRKTDCEKRFVAYQVEENNGPDFFEKYAQDFTLFKQQGINLGERMYHAFQYVKSQGATHMVMIGSDLPNLPCYYIRSAFDHLLQFDVVLGPSFDGGYYLIGLNDPCLHFFEGIQWGSNQVFSQTRKKINIMRKKLAIIKPWYDIDTVEQLCQLKKDLFIEPDLGIAQFSRRALGI